MQAFNVPRHHSILFRDNVETDPVPQDPGFAAEVFHRLYSESPNEMPAVPGNACRKHIHGLIDELPEFDMLRHLTTRDPMWAGMAAASLGSQVAPCVPQSANAQKAQDILDGLTEMQDSLADIGSSSDKLDQAVEEAERNLQAAQAQDAARATQIDESAVRNRLRNAIAQATTDIQDAESALSMLGYGHGQGNPATRMPPSVALHLARKVKSSPKLSEIIELAGRLIRTARAKRASRSEYVRSEVVDVEPTNEVQRLLGTEMALLNDADMSDDLLIRLLEKRAMGFKMAGNEKLAKGPIVAMIDQSGSMQANHKDTWAKAIALALYDAARADKRDFAVVLYDTEVLVNRLITSPQDMLDILSQCPTGGTEYAPAMAISLAMASKKSDIVHITDGDASITGAAAALATADHIGCRIYGIGIGMAGVALKTWSHEITCIDDVTKDSKAMDLIFGEGGV